MQDLIQDYSSDLRKLREVFDEELAATADELSEAMGIYAQRSEAALASFMEKASARGLELEVSATARLSQFCGLPAQPNVDDKPLTLTPNDDVFRIVAVAEQGVADGLQVESESNYKPSQRRDYPGYSGTVRSSPPAQEEHIVAAHSTYVTKAM